MVRKRSRGINLNLPWDIIEAETSKSERAEIFAVDRDRLLV